MNRYCPYCNAKLQKVTCEDAFDKFYYECFECGYCSDEEIETKEKKKDEIKSYNKY